MFKEFLKESLKKIFQLSKVTYDLPGESREQECLFVDVQSARNSIGKKKECSIVRGTIILYGSSDKIPFGFFSKKINQADAELTSNLCFYNMDENTRTIQNIVERRCNFIFLYSNEYDPEGGSLTSLDFDEGA